MVSKINEIQFSDDDVVNVCDYIPAGEYNPHNVRPWLIHDHGFAVCVVFASNLQEALDEAVDNNKLDRWQINPFDSYQRETYMEPIPPASKAWDWESPAGAKWRWKESAGVSFLGNASEPFDIEALGIVEMQSPPMSFCALVNAAQAAQAAQDGEANSPLTNGREVEGSKKA